MFTMNNIKLAAVLVGIAAIVFLSIRVNNLADENNRLEGNSTNLLEQLSDTATYFQLQDSLTAKRVLTLELTNSEMERLSVIDKEKIADLGTTISRLEAYQKTHTETKYIIKEVMKDTIIYVDTTSFTAKTLKYETPFIKMHQVLYPDFSCDITIDIFETLTSIEYYSPRFKIFNWKLGKKDKETVIVSDNPNTKILSTTFITKARD